MLPFLCHCMQLAKYGHLPLYANVTLLNSSTSISGKEMRIMLGASFKVLVDTTPSKLLANKTFVEAVDMVVTTTVGLSAWLGNFSTPVGVMSMLYLNFTTTVWACCVWCPLEMKHIDVANSFSLILLLIKLHSVAMVTLFVLCPTRCTTCSPGKVLLHPSQTQLTHSWVMDTYWYWQRTIIRNATREE